MSELKLFIGDRADGSKSVFAIQQASPISREDLEQLIIDSEAQTASFKQALANYDTLASTLPKTDESSNEDETQADSAATDTSATDATATPAPATDAAAPTAPVETPAEASAPATDTPAPAAPVAEAPAAAPIQ